MGERHVQVESLWDEKRKQLHRLLGDLNKGLAELYKRAIDELDALPSEEMSTVTRSTISYYSRELLNNLPDFLTVDGVVPQRGQYRQQQAKALKRMVELATVSDLPRTTIDGQKALVSGELVEAVHDLVQAYENGTITRLQRDSVTILGRVQDSNAANALLEEARKVLTEHQHTNLERVDNVIAKSAFVKSFKTIEELLLARLGSFFDTAQELRALMRSVEEADAAEELDIDETVRKVLLRLGDYQHRRVFFEGIRSPKWMRCLKNKGAFNLGKQDAANNYLKWPEGDYLVAVAGVCPDDVLDICLNAGESHNPYVQAQVLSAAARLPGDKAMRLHKVALGWSENMRMMPFCFDPRDAAQFVANMFKSTLSSNQLKKAEKALRAFFSPVFERGDDAFYSRSEIVAAIPEYCYRDELEFVLKHSGGKCGYRQISILLDRFERQYCESRHLEYGTPGSCMSWRPSIEFPGNSFPSNYGNYLVDAFVCVLEEETRRSPACLSESFQSKSTLVLRSTLHVLAKFVTKMAPPTREGVEHLSSSDKFIKHLAQSILDDPKLLHRGFDAEAVALVRACMSIPCMFETTVVVGALSEYRVRREKEHATTSWLQGLTETERNDNASRRAIVEEHLLLARIGAAVLPQPLVTRLVELDTQFGAITDDDLSFSRQFGGVSWGYESPIDTDEILRMPTAELSRFLLDWRPKSAYDEPSVTGLANALQQAVSQDPTHFMDLVISAKSLMPRYVGALLRGMLDAFSSGSEVPVDDLAAICSWVCSRMDDGAVEEFDSEATLAQSYDARYDAGDLAKKLALGETALVAESWKRLLEIGVSLCESREPLKEDQFVKSYPEDPTMVLINLLLPKGTVVLARVATLSPIEGVRQEAIDAIKRMASVHQDVLVYGALGMAFSSLVMSSPQCAQEIVSEVLLTDKYDLLTAFVYPAMYWNGYDHEAFCILRPIIQKTILLSCSNGKIARDALTGKTMTHIGIWLYLERETSYMLSHDALYMLWRANASIEERRNTLIEVCRRASYKKASAGIVKCAMGYWDEVLNNERQRGEVGELTGVFLLAHNPTVGVEWLAPRMVIEASENDVSDELAGVPERLVEVARVNPGDAITVLERVSSTQSGLDHLIWIRKALCQMLAYACASCDEAVINRARALMDKLGRQGMIKLDDQVREAIKGLG